MQAVDLPIKGTECFLQTERLAVLKSILATSGTAVRGEI